MIEFGHAGAISRKYSPSIIEMAIEVFPEEYKGLFPIKFLEGIIKKIIIQNPDVDSVSVDNVETRNQIKDMLKEMMGQDES